MQKTNKFLNTLIALMSGMIAGSLWITQSDYWKYYLPICLSCIALKFMLNDD